MSLEEKKWKAEKLADGQCKSTCLISLEKQAKSIPNLPQTLILQTKSVLKRLSVVCCTADETSCSVGCIGELHINTKKKVKDSSNRLKAPERKMSPFCF